MKILNHKQEQTQLTNFELVPNGVEVKLIVSGMRTNCDNIMYMYVFHLRGDCGSCTKLLV